MSDDPCEYVRRMYGVPAEVGMQVDVLGRQGVIENADHQLHVRFTDTNYLGRCHPRYMVTYYTPDGPVHYLREGQA